MPIVSGISTPKAMESRVADRAPRLTVEQAYEHCARLVRSHYENFTVASRLTPKSKLPHVSAIYAWCRTVDDLGDEAVPDQHDPAEFGQSATRALVTEHRLERLAWWEEELDTAYGGQPAHPVTIALQHTIAEFGIPREPFLRLIHANRMDQGSGRVQNFGDLLHYCEHSANPVGHLYLYLFGYDDAERQRLSDFTCTGLQLTNFWQDVARDYQDRDRIYLPLDDMERFGVNEINIASGFANDAFRSLLRHECERAMDLFARGAPLVPKLDRSSRLPVALFTRGGTAMLDAIKKRNYDVLSGRPALSSRRKTWLLLSTLLSVKLGMGYRLPARGGKA